MNKYGVGALLFIAFLIGCAATVVTQSLIVPPIRANTNPTKWEYNCFMIQSSQQEPEPEILNEFGAQGWDLVTNSGNRFCLKRPLL